MKTRTFVSILILVFAVLIIAGSCATRRKAISEKDFFEASSGTWINTEYTGGVKDHKKIFYSDGTWDAFSSAAVTSRTCYGQNTMKEMWTDSKGDIWYTCSWECFQHGSTGYEMGKIINSGKTLEIIFSYGGSPIEEWIPGRFGNIYLIYYRQ
jgi:hypothetical protein